LLLAATRRTSTPTSSPWSRHLRRTSGNGWIQCASTSTIREAGHDTGSRQAFSQLLMASGRSSRLAKRSSMTISVIRNRKAWLPTGSHAGPRQSDSCRGRTSLEESTVDSARSSTGAGKRAMTLDAIRQRPIEYQAIRAKSGDATAIPGGALSRLVKKIGLRKLMRQGLGRRILQKIWRQEPVKVSTLREYDRAIRQFTSTTTRRRKSAHL